MRKSTNQEQSPSFQFYATDWIANPDRMELSLEEQGAYILFYDPSNNNNTIKYMRLVPQVIVPFYLD